MLNASAEFIKEMNNDNRNFLPYIDITLSDNTVLHFTPAEIWEGTFKIEDATSASGKFTIGAAVSTKVSFTINNIYDDYSQYDFAKATAVVKVGLKLEDNTIEKLLIGFFTAVDDPSYNGSTISLELLDNLYKFNKLYKNMNLVYPATLLQILQNACANCGVYLATTEFPNCTYQVATDPSTDTLTYADVIACVAQISGCFAKCDPDGKLNIRWYDFAVFSRSTIVDGGQFDPTTGQSYHTGTTANGGNLTDYTSGDTLDGGNFTDARDYHLFSSMSGFTCSTDDVVITGIKVTEEFKETTTQKKGSYTAGTDSYLIEVSNNVLIEQGSAETVAKYLYSAIGGMKFRPLSATVQSNVTVEAGDVGYLSDVKGNTYQLLVTTRTFTVGSNTSIVCDAESPLRNSSQSYSEMTKAVVKAREEAQVQYKSYDLALSELTNEIATSSGMYETQQVQTDGSVIYIFHNKSDLTSSAIQWKMTANTLSVSTDYGQTWNAGIDASGDAVLHVLSARGVNADWIHGGTLYLGGSNDANGVCYVKDASDNTLVTLDKSGMTLTGQTKIDWDNGTTNIIKNTVTTSYVNALSITADSVAAEHITGTTISGKTISGGSISIGNGNFTVSSSGILTAQGATIHGTIYADKIYLPTGEVGGTYSFNSPNSYWTTVITGLVVKNGVITNASAHSISEVLHSAYAGVSTRSSGQIITGIITDDGIVKNVSYMNQGVTQSVVNHPITGMTVGDGIVNSFTYQSGATSLVSGLPITSIRVDNGIVTSLDHPYSVKSGTLSFKDYSGTSHSITVDKGIITAMS